MVEFSDQGSGWGDDPQAQYDQAKYADAQQKIQTAKQVFGRVLQNKPDEQRMTNYQRLAKQGNSRQVENIRTRLKTGRRVSRAEKTFVMTVDQSAKTLSRLQKAQDGLEKTGRAEKLLQLKMQADAKKAENTKNAQRMTYIKGEKTRRMQGLKDDGTISEIMTPEKRTEALAGAGIPELDRKYAVLNRKKRQSLFPGKPNPKAGLAQGAAKAVWKGSKAAVSKLSERAKKRQPKQPVVKAGIHPEAKRIMADRGISPDQMQQYWDEYQATQQ